MKSIIIYYSQGGSTKKIAQGIQKGIINESGQCDIVRIKDIKPEALVDYDLVGIGSPVWSSCPTTNVIYFEKSLPPSLKGKHFFFYCTHGTLPGRCVIRGVQPLLDQGITVIGWRDWYCGSKVPGHAKPWFTDGHPDAIDLAEAESFGAAMVRHSLKISGGDTSIIPTLPTPEASDQIYGIGHPFIFTARKGEGGQGEPPDPPPPASDKKPEDLANKPIFPSTMAYVMELEGIPGGAPGGPSGSEIRINAEKCTGCGLCAEACFCFNIDASVTPPVIKSQNCEHDLFCEGVCPTGALEFDFRPPDPNMGKQAGPMNIGLDIAEATGRFRRLTKEEDIGWLTPWEIATTHPRHKEIP